MVVELRATKAYTDRRARHRHAALCLATTILILGRLIDWRNRWNPWLTPIRARPQPLAILSRGHVRVSAGPKAGRQVAVFRDPS